MKLIEVMRAIDANERYRNEVVWLRAISLGHAAVADDIERSDPDIQARLRDAGLNLDVPIGDYEALASNRFFDIADEMTRMRRQTRQWLRLREPNEPRTRRARRASRG